MIEESDSEARGLDSHPITNPYRSHDLGKVSSLPFYSAHAQHGVNKTPTLTASISEIHFLSNCKSEE